MKAPALSKDVDFSISENPLFFSHGGFWLLRLTFGHSAQAAHMSEPQIKCGEVRLYFTGLCESISLWVKRCMSVLGNGMYKNPGCSWGPRSSISALNFGILKISARSKGLQTLVV